jgi:hypothetical protein
MTLDAKDAISSTLAEITGEHLVPPDLPSTLAFSPPPFDIHIGAEVSKAMEHDWLQCVYENQPVCCPACLGVLNNPWREFVCQTLQKV